MPALAPIPFSRLALRAFEELDRNDAIFDLPVRKFVLHSPRNTTALMHGRAIAAPLGPSAGPHTQMAQNIVLCWLAGARVIELKTVQILDRIDVPRPCIEMRGAGYNVEWSQELTLAESAAEYVKAAMLIEMLGAAGICGSSPAAFERPLFDISVGYDLAGIRSERVLGFLRSMLDARPMIDALRAELPPRLKKLRDLDFPTAIASSVTLSTFHGCPRREIESIADYLMTETGLDCAVKLNPTLLGRGAVQGILREQLGFDDVVVPESAFAGDPSWDDAAAMVGRLQQRARTLGRGFAVKLTNTLVVENRSHFLPASEKLAYLSGAPLHVIAMHLVQRFRKTFGTTLPISFSAGVDRTNYPDCVRVGLVPVTVCTDLLRQGGYGRLAAYATELARRMDAAGAKSIDELILFGTGGAAASIGEAILRNTNAYVEALQHDPRYRSDRLERRKGSTGQPLGPFDCATCDLCIPACPNDAVFRIAAGDQPLPHAHAVRERGAWSRVDAAAVTLGKPHQIAVYADACNDCGNCEVFCPDLGAPNRLKLRVHGSEESWRLAAPRDGFFVEGAERVLGRVDGREYACAFGGQYVSYSGDGFNVALGDEIEGNGPPEIDLWPAALMTWIRRAILDPTRVNYINCTSLEERSTHEAS